MADQSYLSEDSPLKVYGEEIYSSNFVYDNPVANDSIPDPTCNTVAFMKTEGAIADSKNSVAVSDKYICYTVKGNLLRVIHTLSGEKVLLRGHESRVIDMKFSLVNRSLLCSVDNNVGAGYHVFIWQLQDGSELKYSIVNQYRFGATRVQPHPIFSEVWAVSKTSSIAIFSTDSSRCNINELTTLEDFSININLDGDVTDFSLSTDGHFLAASVVSNTSSLVLVCALPASELLRNGQGELVPLHGFPVTNICNIQFIQSSSANALITAAYSPINTPNKANLHLAVWSWESSLVTPGEQRRVPHQIQGINIQFPIHEIKLQQQQQPSSSSSSLQGIEQPALYDTSVSLSAPGGKFVVVSYRQSHIVAALAINPFTNNSSSYTTTTNTSPLPPLYHITYLNLKYPLWSCCCTSIIGKAHHSVAEVDHLEVSCLQEQDSGQSAVQQYHVPWESAFGIYLPHRTNHTTATTANIASVAVEVSVADTVFPTSSTSPLATLQRSQQQLQQSEYQGDNQTSSSDTTITHHRIHSLDRDRSSPLIAATTATDNFNRYFPMSTSTSYGDGGRSNSPPITNTLQRSSSSPVMPIYPPDFGPSVTEPLVVTAPNISSTVTGIASPSTYSTTGTVPTFLQPPPSPQGLTATITTSPGSGSSTTRHSLLLLPKKTSTTVTPPDTTTATSTSSESLNITRRNLIINAINSSNTKSLVGSESTGTAITGTASTMHISDISAFTKPPLSGQMSPVNYDNRNCTNNNNKDKESEDFSSYLASQQQQQQQQHVQLLTLIEDLFHTVKKLEQELSHQKEESKNQLLASQETILTAITSMNEKHRMEMADMTAKGIKNNDKLLSHIKSSISDLSKGALKEELSTAISTVLVDKMKEEVQSSLGDTVKLGLSRAFRRAFECTLLPGFQAGTDRMFAQVQSSFDMGMEGLQEQERLATLSTESKLVGVTSEMSSLRADVTKLGEKVSVLTDNFQKYQDIATAAIAAAERSKDIELAKVAATEAKRLTYKKIEYERDPMVLLSQGKISEAVEIALESKNTVTVIKLLQNIPYIEVVERCNLVCLLCLIQQLSADLAIRPKDSEPLEGMTTRINWLKELTMASVTTLENTSLDCAEKVLTNVLNNFQVAETLLIAEGKFQGTLKTDLKMLKTIVASVL